MKYPGWQTKLTKVILTQVYRIGKIAASAGIDGFLVFILAAVALAWLMPAIGAAAGTFSLSSMANYGISIIFFFYGLKLGYGKLCSDISNWRLHILIHLTTFVLFPLLVLSIRPLFQGESNSVLWLGIFYLAALPSTVSSSVVMVSIANGNIPSAIFNASISSLIGVFITPLWMSVALSGVAGSDTVALWNTIEKLMLQALLPVALGMALNRRWGSFAEKHNRKIRMVDQSVILLIVYTSFCVSFEHNVFAVFSPITIIGCAAGMLLLFFAVFTILGLASRCLKMNREDTITAQFCGSKKSLVHGAAISKIIFAGHGNIGVILLPIMLYHALQLMVVSAMARKMSK